MPVSARCSLSLAHFFRTFRQVLVDLGQLMFLFSRPRVALAAENLFLRKQLALFQERKLRPRRADDSTRWTMATLSQMFQWRDALVNVKPDTLIRWHRKGFRLFWPEPLQAPPPQGEHRHRLPAGHVVRSRPVLGGLRHEYWLEKVAS